MSPPTWECICARGDFLGANSCPQKSSHSLWERIYLPLVPCTWLPPVVTLLMGRNYPRGVSGAAWALHESGCSPLTLLLWPWSHLSLLFIATPGYRGLRPCHGVAPSMVFPTHGYRGATLWLPCFCDIWPWRRLSWATPYLGDASSRRCPASAMLVLGVASPRRRLMLTLTPTLTLTLTLSTPGYGTVQNKYSAVMKIKKHSNHSKKEYFPQPICS